ncbi:MAG: glycosyltransferase family 39 protein [Chloroflexi bacterium]|nr:glycosyltransferase family 39 protein [Chloroflexota bacterium]
MRSNVSRLTAATAIALLALGVRLPELGRYATIDESRWVARAADFASSIRQRDFAATFLVGHPGVTTMWLGSLGMGSERVAAMATQRGRPDVTQRDGYLDALIAARRLPTVVNAVALGALIWLAAGLIGLGPAAVGGVLMALDPFLGAHSRLIHLDGLLTSFMALAAVCGFACWTAPRRRSAWAYLAGCGLFTGLALLTKAPSVYLLAFLPGVAALQLLQSRPRAAKPAPADYGGAPAEASARAWGVRELVVSLSVWAALAYLVAWTLWPAVRVDPAGTFAKVLQFARGNSGSEHDNYFWGQPTEDPGPLLYPMTLLLRSTPLTMLGLVLAIAWLWRSRRSLLGGSRGAAYLALYALGFALLVTIATKKFDRYLLPAYPGLLLLAGWGLWSAARDLFGWTNPRALRQPGPMLAGAAGVVLAVWPLASVWPYYLAYYDPLAGGSAFARWALILGWGEGLDQVAAYLNRKPIVLGAPVVATSYHRVLQAHLVGTAMPIERSELAEYIVPYVNTIQRHADEEIWQPLVGNQQPEFVVQINGIEYARVYRGPWAQVDRPGGQTLGGLTLDGYTFAPSAGVLKVGDEVPLRLRWRETSPTQGQVVLLLRDAAGSIVAAERRPIAEALREGGLIITDARLKAAAKGPMEVAVRLDDARGQTVAGPTTLERVQAQ